MEKVQKGITVGSNLCTQKHVVNLEPLLLNGGGFLGKVHSKSGGVLNKFALGFNPMLVNHGIHIARVIHHKISNLVRYAKVSYKFHDSFCHVRAAVLSIQLLHLTTNNCAPR